MSNQRIRVPEGLRGAYKVARRMRWVISHDGQGHLRWEPPAGRPVTTPSSPGGGNRSNENSIARLRRAGLPI